MGPSTPATAADAGAAMMRGMAQGAVEGMAQGAKVAADFFGGMASMMGVPSGTGGATPGASADPAAAAAMQGAKAESDPITDFFESFDEPDPADQDFLGARGGGAAAPGADMASREAFPVVADLNSGQAMLMTGQGAVPLVMTQQGPMAVTPRGAVPVQMMDGSGATEQQALQAKARQVQAQALQAQALTEIAARKLASGTSNFVPAKKAPVALTAPAPAPARAPAAPAPAPAKDATAPTTAKLDPKLHKKAGVGTRIGTTGTGDGN